nr:NADH dehydrogenase subunit 6 [Parantropora penelope]
MKGIFFLFFMVFLLFITPLVDSVLLMGGFLFLTVIVAVFLSFWKTSWLALSLFLVYITGLLVLFGYMLAMSPNQSFGFLKWGFYMFFIVLGGLMFFFSVEVWKGGVYKLNGYYSSVVVGFNFPIYWLMGFVLLFVLLGVVNICYKAPAPLRPFL